MCKEVERKERLIVQGKGEGDKVYMVWGGVDIEKSLISVRDSL